jgi:4-amino-4-deoxy-L-arabinose transferase-like glycosyltransferase
VIPGARRDAAADQLDPDPWRQGVQATTFGWANPILHKLVWGLACEPVAPEGLRPNLFFRYHRGDLVKASAAVQPWVPAIERARLVVAAASALCGVLLLLIARRLAGWPAGIAALALWTLHPLVRSWSHQARPDLGMLALVLATLWAALRLVDALRGARGRRGLLLAALALGLLAGLAAGTKLNGGLAGVFAVLAILGTRPPTGVEPPTLAARLAATGLAGAVFLLTLLALLPWAASAPLERVPELLEFWSEHMAFQQDRLEQLGGLATRTNGERLDLMGSRILGRDEPLRAILGLPLGWIAAAAGALRLGRKALREPSPQPRCEACLAGLWIAVILVGSTLWLPLDWDRYFLPPLAALVLLEAILLGALLSPVLRRLRPAPAAPPLPADSPPR